MKAETRCRSCGAPDPEGFFDLGRQPLANALVPDPAVPDRTFPLSLSMCRECGLVQLDHTADPEELFSSYVWVTGTSGTARAYAEDFCNRLLDRLAPGSEGTILEVASNDGTFLKPFLRRGLSCLGVDPAANIVERVAAEGIPCQCGFFGAELAGHLVDAQGPARAVFARNVLPHVAGTNDFVAGLRRCAGTTGLVAVEFHDARVILDELHYDSIYHEHLCYFTLRTLSRLLTAHGLHPFDVEQSPISGGSLVLYAAPVARPKTAALTRLEAEEAAGGANDPQAWRDFAARARSHRDALCALLDAEIAAGRRVVGYGASARSATLLNFCGIGPERIRAIADQNPMKHHLYSPGRHIPILPPEAVVGADAPDGGPDTVVVLAWNFLDEIVGILRERFGFTGRIIRPLPAPPGLVLPENTHDR